MNNWAYWKLSEGGSFGGSMYPIYNLTPRPPRGENVMPILAGEATETDEVVRGIRVELRRAIEVWYLAGGSTDDKRRMLGCRRDSMKQLLEEARREIRRTLGRSAAPCGGEEKTQQPGDDYLSNARGADES
jgi:hypothetical protein